MVATNFLRSVFYIILMVGVTCSGEKQRNELSTLDIAAKLRELKPLQKIHYSWHIERGSRMLESENGPLVYQLARITHSLSVCGEYVTKEQIDGCVYNCARVNKINPEISCRIGVNFSPWHRKFGKNLPPTDRGPTYYAEIVFFAERMNFIKQWVAIANQKYQSDVQVGAVLLDCERFYVKPGDDKWNEGMREALDAIHKKAAEIFPNARIQWYGRGITRPDGETWRETGLWTGKEIKSPMSCSLYMLPEQGAMRETYRRTCVLADKLGIEEVTPYVALAAGYRRDMIKKLRWDYNWDYDLIYSWLLGAELNKPWYAERPEIYAPYNRAKIVDFYPSPFYNEVPAWGRHFIAYVRGANGVKNLNDLK
jgi:hypothetical protein